ncbi:hypothetical protein GLS40_00035 [Pseudooceanicola sp. 216_PA32_1]|uniref:DUF4399 domain-containing protein n=1 Tax=Pseudooceanicola pacificus TaxID=2676438 RepID=A0A844W9V4_9RHOB|nr:hypothetical protein [Pseudooceanicola pacificus]MWB76402.1 hypothetical protein [Pseudooceanicola pacificus]
MKNTLFMLVIGLFFGTGLGFLLAQAAPAPEMAHDHSAHGAPHDDNGPLDGAMAGHDHSKLIETGTPVPSVSAEVMPEGGGGLNIHISLENFAFAPDKVNGPATPGEGHAHIYVNGVKELRAYGPWVNIAGLKPGPAEVRITLNANSHEQLAHDGQPIEATYQVTVE